MKTAITASDFSPFLFWDVDLRSFSLEAHRYFLIERVLEYGDLEDWKLLKKLYDMDTIKIAALNARTLTPVTLAFVSNIFQIDKTHFRCYKQRQLNPNYWNS